MGKEKRKEEKCSAKIVLEPSLQARHGILANLHFNSLSLPLI